MTIEEFRVVAQELTDIICSPRGELGPFRLQKTELNIRGEPSVDANKRTFSISFFLDDKKKEACKLYGSFESGAIFGINELRRDIEDEWYGYGLDTEIMRRFLYGLHKYHFSYASTDVLERGIGFFRRFGFHLVKNSLDLPRAFSKKLGVTNAIEMHRQLHPLWAAFFAPWGIMRTRAILDFTDEAHRNNAFKHLKLPLQANEQR